MLFISFEAAEWPTFEEEQLTRLTLCSYCISFIYKYILVISRFGFEGMILVLIVPVQGNCLLFTFIFDSL